MTFNRNLIRSKDLGLLEKVVSYLQGMEVKFKIERSAHDEVFKRDALKGRSRNYKRLDIVLDMDHHCDGLLDIMIDLKKSYNSKFDNPRHVNFDSLPEFAQNVTGYAQNIGIYYMYFRIREKTTKINICFP